MFVILSMISFHLCTCVFAYLAIGESVSNTVNLKINDFCNSSEKQITDFDLYDPVKHVIGDDLLCIQLDRNLGESTSKVPKAVSGSSHRVLI